LPNRIAPYSRGGAARRSFQAAPGVPPLPTILLVAPSPPSCRRVVSFLKAERAHKKWLCGFVYRPTLGALLALGPDSFLLRGLRLFENKAPPRRFVCCLFTPPPPRLCSGVAVCSEGGCVPFSWRRQPSLTAGPAPQHLKDRPPACVDCHPPPSLHLSRARVCVCRPFVYHGRPFPLSSNHTCATYTQQKRPPSLLRNFAPVVSFCPTESVALVTSCKKQQPHNKKHHASLIGSETEGRRRGRCITHGSGSPLQHQPSREARARASKQQQ
jgi:hypothetical protein